MGYTGSTIKDSNKERERGGEGGRERADDRKGQIEFPATLVNKATLTDTHELNAN